MTVHETTDPLAYLSDLDRERQCYALLQRLVHCERSFRQAKAPGSLSGMGRQKREEWIDGASERLHDACETARVFLDRHCEELDVV